MHHENDKLYILKFQLRARLSTRISTIITNQIDQDLYNTKPNPSPYQRLTKQNSPTYELSRRQNQPIINDRTKTKSRNPIKIAKRKSQLKQESEDRWMQKKRTNAYFKNSTWFSELEAIGGFLEQISCVFVFGAEERPSAELLLGFLLEIFSSGNLITHCAV